MSSPNKRRDMDLTKLMMTDHKVEMINDGMQEFFVEFHGPKYNGSSLDHLEAKTFTESHGNGDCPKDVLPASRKRKWESLSGMINWMRRIAKHPVDPVPEEPSKWKEYKGGNDFFVQLLRARDVLVVRKNVEPKSGSSSQKVKMLPAMYEDPVDHQGTMKLRCSERRHIPVKSCCTGCNSNLCSANGNKWHGSVNMAAKPDATEKKKSAAKSKSTKKKTSVPSSNDFPVKHVCIGPRFQAEVPQWTGEISESDSKWLGTQVWPVKDDSEPTTEIDLVGRGIWGKCSCDIQGSVDCVRFLIAENRMKLKLELGSAFYQLGFDKMGEEVSLQWTADEEKIFKDAMRSNIPSQKKSFWDNPSKYFIEKTRKDAVSYYYNAYIIQLRNYQNQVTPKNVDSDDGEINFGSFGDGFRGTISSIHLWNSWSVQRTNNAGIMSRQNSMISHFEVEKISS